MSAPRLVLVLAAACIASCVASCVLLVSPEDYGERCRFEGEETACGQCIATQCQATIDDCCRADSCTPGLNLIEECAKGDRHLCELIESDLQATDQRRVALASCVAKACGPTCTAGTSVSITKCEASSLARGKTCSCRIGADVNDTDCSEVSFPQTVCCAPLSWPAAGQKCECNTLSCNATADGCSCLLFDITTDSHTCDGDICCQSGDSCRCGSKACSGDAKQVPSCSLETIGCPPNQKRVVSCTASVSQ